MRCSRASRIVSAPIPSPAAATGHPSVKRDPDGHAREEPQGFGSGSSVALLLVTEESSDWRESGLMVNLRGGCCRLGATAWADWRSGDEEVLAVIRIPGHAPDSRWHVRLPVSADPRHSCRLQWTDRSLIKVDPPAGQRLEGAPDCSVLESTCRRTKIPPYDPQSCAASPLRLNLIRRQEDQTHPDHCGQPLACD